MWATMTQRLPEAAPLRAVRWPGVVVAALLLALLFATGGNAAVLWGLTIGLIIFTAGAVDRRLLVPIVIVLLPMEMWQEIAPIEFTGGGFIDRLARSTVLDAGRSAIMALGVYWLLTARAGWERKLPTGRLVLPVLALAGLYVLGTLWSIDFEQGAIFTLALAINVSFFFMIPMLVRDRTTLRLCIWSLIGIMTVLAFAGIYLQVTDSFFWRPDLGLGNTPRVNTTFKDPNIYARILIIAMVLTLAGSFGMAKRWRIPVILGVYAPSILALLFTNSRSGWLLAAGALPLAMVLMPLSRRGRATALAGGAASIVALIIIAEIAFEATFLDRLETMRQGTRALGAREFLIDAAWRMFLDHPITGVGLGGFQHAFQGPYSHYNIYPQYNVSLSHTDSLTILAELGVVGAIVVVFLFYRFGATILDLFRSTAGEDRALAAGLGVAVLVILVSSQAEARLLGEPFLWMTFGLTLALERIIRRDQGLDPADPDD